MTKIDLDTTALDALFQPFNRSDRPGLVVGIALKGKPAYRRGFGMASIELPVALQPAHRLRIGSTSKHFCCLAIMLLGEDGLLSPDDSVRRHIPELGPWADDVTLLHLMTHTGGVRCSLDILTAESGVMSRPLPHQEQVRLITDLATPNFRPGDQWMYSNGGYVLLTEIVRRLGGMSFEEFLRTRIFEPVGMVDTLARPTDTDCLPNSATLHVRNEHGGWNRGVFGPEIGGEGSIVSTVDDMLLWLKHMSSPRVGKKETWDAMRTPAILNSANSTGYGMGLGVGQYRGLDIVHHGGVVVGGTCQMLKVVDLDLDIIMISNLSGLDVAGLTNKVIDACVADLEPVDELTDAAVAFPTGEFYSGASGRYVKLVEKDGGPAMDFLGVEMPLPRRANGDMHLRTNMHTGAAIRASGSGIDWIEFDLPDHLERIAPFEAEDVGALVGAYRSIDTGAEGVVELRGDEAYFTVTGRFGSVEYAMQPGAPGMWILVSATRAFGVTLERDGDDLLFTTSRSTRMRYSRA